MGFIRVEMNVHVGNLSQHKPVYTEITKDGFYLYPSAKEMDEHDRNTAYYVTSSQEAADIHYSTAAALSERLEARKNFVNEFCKEERSEKDKLKRRVKRDPENPELKALLEAAQTALDDKRAAARESDEYKALLVPGKNESITTMFDLDDFSKAVASINVDNKGLEQ